MVLLEVLTIVLLSQRPWPQDGDDNPRLNFTKRQRTADSNIFDTRKSFRSLARQILLFQQIVSHAGDSDKATFEIPAQLLKAWIYLIVATVQGSVNTDLHRSHLSKATSLLQTGMRLILKSFSPSPLLLRSSVLPTELLSLMSLNLLKNWTGTHPSIDTVYLQRLTLLVRSETKLDFHRTLEA